MTVGELKKALEGVPDDMQVVRNDETWWLFVTRAEIGETRPVAEFDLGDVDECERGIIGSTPMFLIS
jgi:hypothetical protein